MTQLLERHQFRAADVGNKTPGISRWDQPVLPAPEDERGKLEGLDILLAPTVALRQALTPALP
jgi:hypothetical protein